MATDIAIFRINYKSDFIITLESDAGWATPFCIKFWTDSPQRAFYVQYDGETYTHCAPVAGEPTKLSVQMDDHHLGVGDLKYQIAYHFTVADFPNDTEDEVLNQAAVIITEDGQQEQVMLDLQGETAPEIAFSLPAYANEAQRIANEQQRIANEEQRITNEEQRIAAEQTRQQNEQQRISNEEARVAEFARLKRESEQATQDSNEAAVLATTAADLATAKAQLAQDAATLANQKAQLAADKAALAAAAADLATAKAQLAQEKATYAQTQGDYAKAQGTIAEADHVRAESDHTRAENDHAAVEVYVDSLGAFDISAYHATGGVLAKYADLTAALGTDGVNIPDALRKGGMSVKFVQSSDNKYIKFFCTAQDFTTDVTQWQGVDDEPIQGSDNLVKSGGVFAKIKSIIDASNLHNLALVNGSVPLLSGSAFVDTGETYNGQPIWRLTSSSSGYTGMSGYYTALPQTTSVNTKLKVAFKAKKASSEASNNVWVRFFLNNTSGRGFYNVDNLTDNWKQIILDFTVDITMLNTKTSLRWGKPSGSYLTDVYITDIVLYYDNEDFYPSNIIPSTIEKLEKGIKDNTENISQINNEVSDINRKVEKGSIIYRNEDINDAIGAAGYYYVGQTKKKFLQLLVGADIHGDNYQYGTFQEKPMPSMVDYLNGINNIDAGIMLGDIVYYNFSDNIDFYVNAIANAEKPFLTVIGNHDAGLYADPNHSYDTVADLYNKMIAPTIQYAALESGEFTSGNTYYFKDFTDYNVRIIVLNQYEYPDSKTEFPRGQKTLISQSQINWLIATLGSTPADYHIVIALHSSPSPSMLSKESKFTSNMYSVIAAGQIFGQDSFISGDIIPDIVNAWINGTSLNESYTVTSATGTVSSLSVAADFTLRGIGKFAGYIGGHWHSSVISCVNKYQTQKLYSTDCSALRNQAAYCSDMPRLVNTKSQDCYAVVTIDTVHNWIKITKVGARYTEDMTERFITKI